MMDRGNLGHIIKRGDCVGKEKAVVKDIGTGYITFVIAPDARPTHAEPRPPRSARVQLYPNGPAGRARSRRCDHERRRRRAPIVDAAGRRRPTDAAPVVRAPS